MVANHAAIEAALSRARVSTYFNALKPPPAMDRALALYVWNAHLAAALMVPLSICEVVIRNAAADALALRYGGNWPSSPAFRGSLRQRGRDALDGAVRKHPAAGKVIAELTFGFWQQLFTGAFDGALWKPYLYTVLPRLPRVLTVQAARAHIFAELEALRLVRNRIAHHEPLLVENVPDAVLRAARLVDLRCADTMAWLQASHGVDALLNSRPD
ncbi:hypothetical protein [Xenophilus azovorans]|uniref:hypothetical protein n=1 Tax=Xenophilus azovorans TaxID=151755 RepID=UPI000571D8F3|nr:hypothetical protein [Xenophilus azovorans]